MRTDQTRICRRCALRTGEPGTCPRCGEPEIIELNRATGRKALITLDKRKISNDAGDLVWLSRLEGLGFARREWTFVAFHRAVFLVGLSFVLGLPLLMLLQPPIAPWLLAVPLAAAGSGVLGADLAQWRLRRRQRLAAAKRERRELPQVEVGGRPLLAAPASGMLALAPALLTGKVRARQVCTSPLAQAACVGFRLVGVVGRFDVDDSGGEAFDLVREDGSAVRVRLDHAALVLEVGEPAAASHSPGLAHFLAGRGIPRSGAMELAEGLLRDGDPVVVTGTIEKVAEPDGFRGTRYVDEVRGRADAPVIVRSPG